VIVRCRRCDTYFHVDDDAAGGRGGATRVPRCTRCRAPLTGRPGRRGRALAGQARSGGARGGDEADLGPPAREPVTIALAASPRLQLDLAAVDRAFAAFLSPSSPEADLFKRLRARLFVGAKKPPRSIFVTSALPGEGKTVVAANLAASIAQSAEGRALLVDANPRSPRAAQGFGIVPARGLLDWLEARVDRGAATEADLTSFVLRLPIGDLSLLPLGPPTPQAAELLASARVRDLLRELAARDDGRTVVIDGPSLSTPEALTLAQCADGVLLVVRAHATPASEVQRARKALAGLPLLGIVLNEVEPAQVR
jgi:predicted Zn finger-like uncharacterized protein